MPRSLLANVDLRTGGRLAAAPDDGVRLTSRDLGWRGLQAELHRLGPTHQPAHLVQTHRLMVHRGPPTRFEFRDGGDRWQTRLLQRGDVSLLAHGAVNEPRWHDGLEMLAIGLDPDFVDHCFGDDAASRQLDPIPGRADPVVEHFADLLQRELADPLFCGALFGETLALGLARHLARPGERGRAVRGALSGAQIGRAFAHLREHIAQDVGLQALAEKAHVSPFHFARLFRAATGLPPHQFVLQLRIHHAQQLMRSRRRGTLADIALAAGFFDQAHFTRTFRRVVGITPAAFAATA